MNPINLSWSKLVVTAVSVVALSPISSALAVSRLSSPVASKLGNSPQTQLLVGQSEGEAIDIPVNTSFSPEKKSAFTLYIWQPGGTIK